jgi:hypothetical protein
MRPALVVIAGLAAAAIVVVLVVSLLPDDGNRDENHAMVVAGAREAHQDSRYRRFPITELDCSDLGNGQWDCRYTAGPNQCYVSAATADGEGAYFSRPVCQP